MGNVHHRDTNDEDDEFKRTYASEPTLPEKYGNSKQRTTAKVSTTTFWIVSLIIAVVSFTSYKTGSEIIRRVITDVDDCANNPCLNGGQCEDKVFDYVCKCKSWYSGKNCEINEACANHKCQCGGTCVAEPDGSYKCICPPRIHGVFCERPHSGTPCH